MTLIYKQDRMPQVVVQVLSELGWVEFDEKEHDEDEWNLHWKPTRYVIFNLPLLARLVCQLKTTLCAEVC